VGEAPKDWAQPSRWSVARVKASGQVSLWRIRVEDISKRHDGLH